MCFFLISSVFILFLWMSSFQKAILWFVWVVTVCILYYFLSVLPEVKSRELELKEREIRMKEEQQVKEQEIKDLEIEAKQKKEEENLLIEKEKDCLERWEKLKLEFNNFRNAYYDKQNDICIWNYFDDNWDIQEGDINFMWKIYKKPLPERLYGKQIIKKWVNLRWEPVNWNIFLEIDPSNEVEIVNAEVVNNERWYFVLFHDKAWRISSIAFWQ